AGAPFPALGEGLTETRRAGDRAGADAESRGGPARRAAVAGGGRPGHQPLPAPQPFGEEPAERRVAAGPDSLLPPQAAARRERPRQTRLPVERLLLHRGYPAPRDSRGGGGVFRRAASPRAPAGGGDDAARAAIPGRPDPGLHRLFPTGARPHR